MQEKRFTPGPWFEHREGFSTVYIEARLRPGVIQEVAACGPTESGSESQSANARLISAAPELLEALQEFSRQYGRLWDTVNPTGGGFLTPESVVEYDRIHQLATAAIAKALGKE